MYHADLLRVGRTRHARYYLNQMRVSQALYTRGGDETIRAVQSISAIWPQILEAYSWSASQGQMDADALKLCVAFTSFGADFLPLFQPLPDQIDWLETALDAALHLRDYAAAANALLNLARAYEGHHSHDQAISAYERALAIARAVYDPRSEARALVGMGRIRGLNPLIGDLARKQVQAGLAIFREVQDQAGIGQSLQGLSTLEQMAGHLEDAQAYAEQAAAISRQSSHPQPLATALIRLAAVAVRRQDYQRGKEVVQEALHLARQLGDHQLVCQSISRLGLIEYWLGDVATCKVCFDEMLSLARRHGLKDSEGLALFNLAWVSRGEGRLDQAEAYYREVIDLATTTGYHLRAAFALEELGYLYIQLGRLAEARTHLHEGVALLQALQAEPFEFLYALTGFAWLLLREGKPHHAAAIMGMVMHHPAYHHTEQEQAVQDQRVMSELSMVLAPDALDASLERGKHHTMDELLAVLPDLSGGFA